MTQMLDRPTSSVDERIVPVRPVPAPPKRSGLVRWLGWILAGLLVVGGAVLFWDDLFPSTTEVTAAPALSDIDPYLNPEVMTGGAVVLVTPEMLAIDLHRNPELKVIPFGPSIDSIDPYLNPEVMTGGDAVLVTPEMIANELHRNPELKVIPFGPSIDSIDPHQSPEVVLIP